MTEEKKSPFKFLDSFTIDDKDSFFGRDLEIDTLYDLAFETSLILVYGPSGAGKTSLIQCGLAGKFEDTDWFALPVRRKTNINDSIRQEIDKHAITPVQKGMSVAQAVNSLYLDYFKPIYLIFDQFEEMYILGSDEERIQFIQDIKELLEADFPRKVVVVMREEYIARLYDFEKKIPQLFDYRVRVEPMNVTNVEKVIQGSARKFQIRLEPEEETITSIIDHISHGKSGIHLSYLQVYLDRLYREAANGEEYITFKPDLVANVGDIGGVLGEFLEQQIKTIQNDLLENFPDVNSQAVKRVLSTFVTLEGTKRPIPLGDISIAQMSNDQLKFCLNKLEKARILRLEDEIFELAHDTLAVQIASERDASEIAFLEMVKLVKDRFYAYDRTQTLLNQSELHLINTHKSRAEEEGSFSAEEWAFIKKSSKNIRRRRLSLAGFVLIIILSLTSISIYTLNQREVAVSLQEEAEKNLQKLQKEQIQKEEAKYNEHLAKGKTWMTQNDFLQAIQEFGTALAFRENGREADSLRTVCKEKIGLKNRFESFIVKGDAFYNEGPDTYMDAISAYRVALSLGFNNELASNKISTVSDRLDGAYENFMKKGDAFYNAEACDLALIFFKKALRIKPGDRLLSERIKECDKKLNP